MKIKYTTEEFDKYLNSFNEGNVIWMNNAVGLVTSNALWSEVCADISNYRKQSLVRKVLRYVAQTAMRGTFEIDGLSVSAHFCEMRDGDPVSFGSATKWSFWSHRLNKKVFVEITEEEMGFSAYTAHFYDENKTSLMSVEIWPGCHWTMAYGRVDLVEYFEDTRHQLSL